MFAPLHVFAGLNEAPSVSAVLVNVKAAVAASAASGPASPLPPDDEVDPDEDELDDEASPPLLEPPLDDDEGVGLASEHAAVRTATAPSSTNSFFTTAS